MPQYLELSRAELASGVPVQDRPVPALEQMRKMVLEMPDHTTVERRDRAIIAAALLFGARANVLASLRIKHLDIENKQLNQDATQVRVKNSKSQLTDCFPVGDDIWLILTDFVRELRTLGFVDDDAQFPPNDSFEKLPLNNTDKRKTIAVWTSQSSISKAFERSCAAADLAYYNPHSFRHGLTALGEEICKTDRQKTSWYKNLGHSSPIVSQTHYNRITESEKKQTMRDLGTRVALDEENQDLLLAYYERRLDPSDPEYKRIAKLAHERQGRNLSKDWAE